MQVWEVFLFIGIFILLIFSVFLIKKLFYRFVYKKKYMLFQKISIKSMSNIGIVLALSLALIFLLNLLSIGLIGVAFKIWSGARVIVESILIKIGGLLFGPLIGMFLGASIDFLVVALSAGVFHFGYFIIAILFGFLGGIIKSLLLSSKKSYLKFCIFSTVFVCLLSIISILLFFAKDNNYQSFVISFLSFTFELNLMSVILVIVISSILSLLVLWVCYFNYVYLKKKKKNKKGTWFEVFAPVFMMIIITEIFCNILILPTFDAMISPLNYSTWFVFRLVLFVPMVIINLIIIYPVALIIMPIIKFNHIQESTNNFKKTNVNIFLKDKKKNKKTIRC